jgi:hypothetical protein
MSQTTTEGLCEACHGVLARDYHQNTTAECHGCHGCHHDVADEADEEDMLLAPLDFDSDWGPGG